MIQAVGKAISSTQVGKAIGKPLEFFDKVVKKSADSSLTSVIRKITSKWPTRRKMLICVSSDICGVILVLLSEMPNIIFTFLSRVCYIIKK